MNLKKQKYKAVKTEFDGIVYDSKKEADHAKDLSILLKSGKITGLRRQVIFRWDEKHIIGNKEKSFKRKYIADFVYFDLEQNKTIIVDVKGFRTAEYKKKKKIVECIFEIKITEV